MSYLNAASPVLEKALNRLAKWRRMFALWHFAGQDLKGHPSYDAMTDLREVVIIMRAELSAMTQLMVKKGVFTQAEWDAQMAVECVHLQVAYEKLFPGIKAYDMGLEFKNPEALQTMRRLGFLEGKDE